MPKLGLILLAAGQSSRFGGSEKKPFVELDGKPVWLHSLHAFQSRDDLHAVVIAVSADDRELFELRATADFVFVSNAMVVTGGARRCDSVRASLAALPEDCDLIAIHDAARPCVSGAEIEAVVRAAERTGAALLAAPLRDTLKRGGDGLVTATVPRDGLWKAQTPQVFRREVIMAAYAALPPEVDVTDDVGAVERIEAPVALAEGRETNLKLTAREDLALAAAILAARRADAPRFHHPFADERAS
jgi:2-C-methyl-D-erythritol 4-phosphate cytidylyltransferase